MADWNPNLYLKFQTQRTQPALDLAMRVSGCSPNTIVDVGCGPGNSTAVLKSVFPQADLLGIDSSPSMIERAQAEYPDLQFRLCGALDLTGTYDLLFSNACLQWIPNHPALIPALMERLNPGGVLAVQIPINGEEPLFQLVREVAAEERWGLADAALPFNEVLAPSEYFDILSDCAASFDLWETRYYHPLANHRALIEWIKSTRLRPYLQLLGEARGEEFLRELTERARERYPLRKNGAVVLGFRRLFFTARR